jgi:outer membrane protein TolC
VAALAVFPALKAGLSIERDDAGRQFMGPAIAAEIPLFDLGFARRAHARAESDLARKRMAALESGLRPRIRMHYLSLIAARRNYEEASGTLIPLRETASAEALRQYNFMLAGVYRLLETRREELAARILSTEALQDYWIAGSELERHAGGPVFKTDKKPDHIPGDEK